MCLYIQPALKQLSLWNKSIHASSHIVTSYILDVQQNMKNIKPMLNTFPQLVFGRWWELSEMGPSENSLDIWTLFQKETMKVWSILPLLFSLPSYEVSSFVLPNVPHHFPSGSPTRVLKTMADLMIHRHLSNHDPEKSFLLQVAYLKCLL